MTRAPRLAALCLAHFLVAPACGGADNQPLLPETIDYGLNYPDGLGALTVGRDTSLAYSSNSCL